MTTDTAVRVTRMVVEGKSRFDSLPVGGVELRLTFCAIAPLEEIPYLDSPELKFNEHESTELPFRYVKGDDGGPIMPEVIFILSPPPG